MSLNFGYSPPGLGRIKKDIKMNGHKRKVMRIRIILVVVVDNVGQKVIRETPAHKDQKATREIQARKERKETPVHKDRKVIKEI